MIAIIDYDVGNSASIKNMLSYVGGEAVVTNNFEQIVSSEAIILPGVGAYDAALKKLKDLFLFELVLDLVLKEKKPILGICLGMQLLFETSEEGSGAGLGIIPGYVKRFNFLDKECLEQLKIPHMGWNAVQPVGNSRLFEGISENRFYFAHSYYVNCLNNFDVAGSCLYGHDFTCAVERENVFGAQFHPEKSHRYGMVFFENFLKVVKC